MAFRGEPERGVRCDDRDGFVEFLRTPEAQRAEEWQLRELARMQFPQGARPGTYKALRAAMDLLEDG